MNINKDLEQSSKEYGVNTGRSYFKFQKGENRLRILTEGKVIATHFFGKGVPASTCYGEEKGCPFHGKDAPKKEDANGTVKEVKPSIKYVCYVLNIKDKAHLDNNEVELADLPYSVIKQVGDFQNNSDYAFDAFPMPYDVTVTFDPDAKSPINMYKIIPSPKREEVSDTVKGKLASLMTSLTPEESVQRKKDYQVKKHQEQGIWKGETTKKTTAELNQEYKEKVDRGELDSLDASMEYPTEQISPDDIPF